MIYIIFAVLLLLMALLTSKKGQAVKATGAIVGSLVLVAGGYVALDDGGLHEQARLVENECRGTYCTATFTINATTADKEIRKDIDLVRTFEDKKGNKKNVTFTTDFEIYHYSIVNVTREEQVLVGTDTLPNSSLVPIYENRTITVEKLVRVDTGKTLAAGKLNYIHYWTKDFNEEWVDWQLEIKGIPKKVFGINKDVTFDTHNKEWAVWSVSGGTEASYDFDYVRNVTLNSTVSSNLTDFPAYFKIDTQTLISAGKMQSDCDDLRVTNDTEEKSTVTLLNYEVENGTCNTTTTMVWVKVPTLKSTTTVVTIYYGNTSVTSKQNASGVWSNNYTAVYHMSDYLDSTGRYNLSLSGSALTAANCNLGKCYTFGGASALSTSSFNFPANNFTVFAVNTPSSTTAYHDLFGVDTNSSDYSYVQAQYRDDNDKLEFAFINSGATAFDLDVQTATTYTANTWYAHHLMYDATGNNATIHINASQSNTDTTGTRRSDISDKFVIGAVYYLHALGNYYRGTIDELRVSGVTRSQDWMTAEVKQTYTLGSEANTTDPVPSGITWLTNITNQTVNHNGSPYILYYDFNATNRSPAITVKNYTVNSTHFAMNNTTGVLSKTGSNISATGVYWLNVTAYDNSTGSISQVFWVNITNTAPVNNWSSNNYSQNHNTSKIFPNWCSDPDGDTITETSNVTNLPILSNGSINFTAGISKTGTYYVNVGCSDGNINSTAISNINITNTAPTNNWANLTFNHNASKYFAPNCTDIDGDAITFSGNVSNLTHNSNGSIQYTANINKTGVYSDVIGCSDTKSNTTAQITINITNTVPSACQPSINCTDLFAGGNCSAYAMASDPDGDPLTVSWNVTQNTTLNSSGTKSYTSGQNQSLVNLTSILSGYYYSVYCNSTDRLLFSTAVNTTTSIIDSLPSEQLCANMTDIYFAANTSRGNYTASTNRYSENDILPKNITTCNYVWKINNTVGFAVRYTVSSNLSTSNISLAVNGSKINSTTNHTFSLASLSVVYLNVTMNMTNITLTEVRRSISINITEAR